MSEKIKVNVGSGGRPMAGYLNTDVTAHPGVDRVCEAWSLGLPDESVSEIQCHHVIEHFFPKDWAPTLAEFWRVLEPGGKIVLSCPDFGDMAKGYAEGRYTIDDARQVVMATVPPFNSCNYDDPASYHRTVHSEISLRADLKDRGFDRIASRHEGFGWNLFVEAVKPKPDDGTRSTLCLVVLAQSHKALDAFHCDRSEVDELVMIVNPGARFGGLGAVANRVLDRTACDVFGIVHADTSFEPGALRTFAKTAASGKVTGMVGRHIDLSYIWSRHVAGEVAVSTLDSCSVFFKRSSGLRFDVETFDSFHCTVEDLCLAAAALNIPVVVPSAQAAHHADMPTSAWHQKYAAYRQKLAEKWAGVTFTTT